MNKKMNDRRHRHDLHPQGLTCLAATLLAISLVGTITAQDDIKLGNVRESHVCRKCGVRVMKLESVSV